MAAKAGHYESFYLKACGRAAAGASGSATPSTSARAPSPTPRSGSSSSTARPTVRGRRRSRCRRAELSRPEGIVDPGRRRRDRPRRRRGRGRDRGTQRRWELTFSAEAEPCKYLPADWLYEAPVPKTKFVAPVPARPLRRPPRDRRRGAIELDGWPGMIGHNWGSEHAERWVWLEGTGFEDAPGAYFDAGAARIKVGPLDDPLGPLGDAGPRRRGAPARRFRQGPLGLGRGLADRLLVRPSRRGRRRPRPGLGPAEGLRRLGLRRPQGTRAQHRQLLGRRPRADRRTPGPPGPHADPRRPARPTSAACGRPTTASRSSPTRTAERGSAPGGPPANRCRRRRIARARLLLRRAGGAAAVRRRRSRPAARPAPAPVPPRRRRPPCRWEAGSPSTSLWKLIQRS